MSRPIRVLELRSADRSGGGPDKTILLGARLADRSRVAVTVTSCRPPPSTPAASATRTGSAAAARPPYNAVNTAAAMDGAISRRSARLRRTGGVVAFTACALRRKTQTKLRGELNAVSGICPSLGDRPGTALETPATHLPGFYPAVYPKRFTAPGLPLSDQSPATRTGRNPRRTLCRHRCKRRAGAGNSCQAPHERFMARSRINSCPNSEHGDAACLKMDRESKAIEPLGENP